MKKFVFILTGLIASLSVNAQSLEEIIKSYSAAINADKLATLKTIKITGKMTAMGMEMPMVMFMKNPNKIKVTYSFSGQDMVSVFDGEKGYMINPMMGSEDPVELTGDQLEQVKKSSTFNNELMSYYRNGKLTLEGEENVNDKPAFKIKADVGNAPVFMFLDKGSYLIVKTSTTVDQMGTSMIVDSYMTDYTNTGGVIIPKKTTAMAGGMEAAVITFDKIEVDLPMEDDFFKLK